jgi:hypothetical protein
MANASDPKVNQEADWISLMDYATQYGVSLSTLRRHIKAGKIQYRVEGGRYLLRCPLGATTAGAPRPVALEARGGAAIAAASGASASEIAELRTLLERAQEEIAELKMLIALYEERLPRENPLRVNG